MFLTVDRLIARLTAQARQATTPTTPARGGAGDLDKTLVPTSAAPTATPAAPAPSPTPAPTRGARR